MDTVYFKRKSAFSDIQSHDPCKIIAMFDEILGN